MEFMPGYRIKTFKTHIAGLVQGVGFRPFIYRLAMRYNLRGWVENRNDGVLISVNCTKKTLHAFIDSIKNDAPVASRIFSITILETGFEDCQDFRIIRSENTSQEITEISPDIAVCDECVDDMGRQPHRIDYPFINCTNCGPRFTIIRDLPYDRDKTTMDSFNMCSDCAGEYNDIMDRRFHAQPIACMNCGPEYKLYYDNDILQDIHAILRQLSNSLEKGQIIAVKGMGGFHLACDAQNEVTVNRLRENKNRDGKPFAVMFKDIASLKEYALVGPEEESLLCSWVKPIVILKEKTKLAHGVSNGFNTIGAMLPYMPFHYLLFRHINLPAIVLTSGNISDEPIVIDNEEAKERLLPIADALLVYNRKIYNRTDDSVVMVTNNKERLIRRSRGYVPSPIRLNIDANGIFAAGAELVNCFCMGKNKLAFLSQHIGDLKNLETLDFYNESVDHFKKLFRIKPDLAVADMHPDYLSTRYASQLGLPVIHTQHHHAHIASCMAEHGLDEKVIGVALDGTGYGDDQCIWGAEFMVSDLAEYQRILHFDYVPMPGGDNVIHEPWRMAVSYLYQIYGPDLISLGLPFLKGIEKQKILMVMNMLEKGINSPLTSSAGRLFDAIAAMTNLCPESSFHAEAPMRLEQVLDYSCKKSYPFSVNSTIRFSEMIRHVVLDIKDGMSVSIISAKFHNTIINSIFAAVKLISDNYHLNKVVLSGGSLQNRYILKKIENKFSGKGFEVFTHSMVPSNDGGIALGQLAIAAKRRS
jgi:hydrogenase maturation protein HypF